MVKSKKEEPQLFPLEVLTASAKLPAWELAALRQATGWAEGKEVSKAVFDEALTLLRSRPVGGGKL